MLCFILAVRKFYTPTSAEEISLASDLLKFLIKNLENCEQLIFEFNIELIRSVVTVWKDIIHVPSRLLLDMCSTGSSYKNKYGLNLLGIILSNELIPWTDAILSDYLHCLLKNTLKCEEPSIFKTSSNVLGMSLSILEKMNETEKVEYTEDVLKETLKLWNNNKEDKYKNQFRDVLYGLSRSYPGILRHFRTIIQSKIPSSTCVGKIKSIYMEMFLISLDFCNKEDLYADITSIKLHKLLKSTDYQLLALHILNKSLPYMKKRDINTFIKEIEQFCINSKNVDCRRLAYEFNIFLVTNYTEDTVHCQNIILKGFDDPSTDIQNRIINFWSKQLDSFKSTSEKLQQLIRLGADTNCSKVFFSFCINIILRPALEHVDAVKDLLTVPIDDSDNKLIEYHVNTNSKSKTYLSSLPYFAMDISLKHLEPPNRPQFGLRRENENDPSEHFFTPTQDLGFLSKTTQNFTMTTQASMLFNVPIHILDNRSNILQTAIMSVDEKFSKDCTLNYLRPRFIKTRNKEFQLIDYKRRVKFEKKEKVIISFNFYKCCIYDRCPKSFEPESKKTA